MHRSIELALKAALPLPVGRAIRRADNYRQRLVMWGRIFLAVRGVTPADRRIIRRSAAAAPRRALRNLLRWQNPVLLADATVEVRGLGRFKVRGQSDDLFHVFPSREPEVFDAIRRNLRLGDVFVDAGANMGVYSILAGRLVGPGGQVLAIEMMPETAAILRQHLAVNAIGWGRVVEGALAGRSGEKVTASFVPGHFGMATIAPRAHRTFREVEVETTTLDELTENLTHIALMKMDLEGAELAALKGASRTLTKTRAIIFEQNRGDAAASELLESRGFRVSELGGKDRIAIRESD